MGPQNSSDRHLYSGSGDYTPSERASAGVSGAQRAGSGSSPVVAEKASSSANAFKSQESTPKQPVGGTPPSQKAQASARHNDPQGTSVADERA